MQRSTPGAARPWRALLLDDGRLPRAPLAAFAATRAALFAAVWLALSVAGVREAPGLWRAFPGCLALDGWARWDSGWYWSIAQGYWHVAGNQSNVNFFPLYPWLTLALSLPLRAGLPPEQAFFLAGMLVSNAAFLLACLGVWRLGTDLAGPRAGAGAVWLFAAFPFSFFGSAVYSESLFVALAVWAFLLWRSGRPWSAAACAALAAVTRVPGFLVATALGIEWLRERGWRPWPPDRKAAALALTPWALAGLLLFFFVRFGDPLVFRTTQEAFWGRPLGLGNVVKDLAFIGQLVADHRFGHTLLVQVSYLCLVAAAVPLGVWSWRRLGAGYGFYVLASLALIAPVGLGSTGRYVFVLFPVTIAAAALLRRAMTPVALASAGALVYFAIRFARWMPVY